MWAQATQPGAIVADGTGVSSAVWNGGRVTRARGPCRTARARADPPDLESAEEHYRQALLRADELGMRPLVAHCHLGLGTLYRRTGKREEAHAHLTTAMTMYCEMGMNFWLERAESALTGAESWPGSRTTSPSIPPA